MPRVLYNRAVKDFELPENRCDVTAILRFKGERENTTKAALPPGTRTRQTSRTMLTGDETWGKTRMHVAAVKLPSRNGSDSPMAITKRTLGRRLRRSTPTTDQPSFSSNKRSSPPPLPTSRSLPSEGANNA